MSEQIVTGLAKVESDTIFLGEVAKLSHRFEQYQSGAGTRAKAIIGAVMDHAGDTVEAVQRLTSGLIESSRVKVDDKWQDGEKTADIRKFVSYVRAVWGAVMLGRFPGYETYTNNEKLVQAARLVLSGKTPDGGPADGWEPVDWKGVSESAKATKAAKKEMAEAMKEAAPELGIEDERSLLTLTQEQFANLQTAAKAKLSDKRAKERVAAMEKAADKIAERLLKDYGPDDAETVLKRALERLTERLIGAVVK